MQANLMHIVLGAVLVAIGAIITIKSKAMLAAFGRVPWFERHLDLEGGSRLFYQLLGVAIVLSGFLIMAGIFQNNLSKFASPYFRF